MIARWLAACSRLDRWLHTRGGRPYGIALTIGLVIETVHKLSEMPRKFTDARGLLPLVLVVLMNAGLLLHQLAELGERVGGGAKGVSEEA